MSSVLKVSNVTASGFESPNYPRNTIDNNLSTRWSCEGIGSWIKLDLGSTFTITDVKIAWYNGNIRVNTFRIDVSNDSINWQLVFSGKSSGTTANFEDYTFSQTNGRYVKITFEGNTLNDWCSILEIQVDGITTTPPPPPPTTNTDINGVKMLYPSSGGPSYFYKMGTSLTTGPASGKYIYLDDSYNPIFMSSGGVSFVRLTATNVSYASGGTGKTMRININAGGYISTQAHTWQNSGVSYIWTSSDQVSSEFTVYFRVSNYVQSHTECAVKLRGGIHTGSNDPRASCFQTNFFIGGGSTATESALEYIHPSYHFSSITPLITNQAKAGVWIGRKVVCWNGKDGKVHTEDYIDWNPFTSTGIPANNWQKFFTQTFVGDSTYNKVPLWGGMTTFRQDGYGTIDVAIISVREIIPPA